MPTTEAAGISYEEVRLRLVPASYLPYVWDDIAACMEENPRGLLDGFYSLSELRLLCVAGMLDVWVWRTDDEAVKCVVLCRVEKFSNFQIYRIVWVGGKAKPIMGESLSMLEAYATEVVKANFVALDGRLGWVRRLAPFGFKVVRFEMWKKIGRSH